MTASSLRLGLGTVPERRAFAVTRVYPRLTVGGAEADILELLAGIGDTQMLVTEEEGPAAVIAKQRAAHYERLVSPRFETLCEAMRASPLVHLHTINNHPLAPLAAQLTGRPRIVQTVHNDFDCEVSHFVDHSIVVAPETRWRLAAPNRTSHIPSGIAIPAAAGHRPPLGTPGRPVRLLEIRRPDKDMHLTLEQILATGLLEDVAWEATVVGVDGQAADARIKRVGAVADPTAFLAVADVLVHASAVESFGRVVFEAMAHGALVLATALPPYMRAVSQGALLHLVDKLPAHATALELRKLLRELESDAAWASTRARNHAFVGSHHSTHLMLTQTQQVYHEVRDQPRPARNFLPEDAHDGDFSLFAATVDALLERKQPPAMYAGRLSPRQRATLLWIAARYGVLRLSLVPRTLDHVAKALGMRPLLALDLARHYAARDDLQGALHMLDEAVDLDPEKIDPYLGAIAIHLAGDHHTLSQRWIARLEQRWPEHPLLPTLHARSASSAPKRADR